MRRLVFGLAFFSLFGVGAASSAMADHGFGKHHANSGRGLIARRPACPSCQPGYGDGYGYGAHRFHGHHGHHGLHGHAGLGHHGLGHHGGNGLLPGGGMHYRPPTEPAGGPVGTYAYPYYTIRGPRDFLMANPPSIGPY